MKISQKLTLTVLAGFILSCNVQAAGPNDCKENERWVQIGADWRCILMSNTNKPGDQERNLSTNLYNAVQEIPTIIFALPNPDGSWQQTGQVKVSAKDGAVTIDGALVTNVHQQNTAKGNIKNASLIGGHLNYMQTAAESTIIGGFNNLITTIMSFIAGGTENKITGGSRSTILGGNKSSISGETSTSIGGAGNKSTGDHSTTIGGNSTISGANSLAAGNNVVLNADNTFTWNDGKGQFNVAKPHLFAVKGAKGMVVGKNTPNKVATLSIKGGLRVQYNEKKNQELGTGKVCDAALVGTIKTVKALYNSGSENSNQYCPCLCTGKEWTSMLMTPQCINACEGREPTSNGKDFPVCGATFGTCNRGSVVTGAFSYVYGNINGNANYQGGNPYQNSWGVANHWYWVCRNPETNVSVTCETNFSCRGTSPANANICSYSTTNASESKKDDRELNQNVNKKLIGVVSNRCKSSTDTSPKTRAELDTQINNCTQGTHPDDDQNKKCQFYCPDGWHRESDGNCYQNSCKYEPINSNKTVVGNKYVTFKPACLNHGGSIQNTQTVSEVNGNGTRTFTANFSCNLGVRTKTNETASLSCNRGYYRRDKGTSTTYDDECLPTRWVTGGWYGCTAAPRMEYGTCTARPQWSNRGTCNNGTQSRSCYGTSGTRYGTCYGTNGTEYRNVSCQTYGNATLTVADGYCAQSRPTTTQWCNRSCTQPSSVSCNSYCNGSSSQSCGDGCTNGSTQTCNGCGTRRCSNGSRGSCSKSAAECTPSTPGTPSTPTPPSCTTAPKCGTAHGTTVSSRPSSNLCSQGTASSVTGNWPWTWTCSSANCTTANCTAYKQAAAVNGKCGSAATTTTSKPTSNLCSAGTASSVSGNDPWTRTCAGTNGGSTASCSAKTIVYTKINMDIPWSSGTSCRSDQSWNGAVSCGPFGIYIYTSRKSEQNIRNGTNLATKGRQSITLADVPDTRYISALSDGTPVSSLAKGTILHVYATPNSQVYHFCTAGIQGAGYSHGTATVGKDNNVRTDCYD